MPTARSLGPVNACVTTMQKEPCRCVWDPRRGADPGLPHGRVLTGPRARGGVGPRGPDSLPATPRTSPAHTVRVVWAVISSKFVLIQPLSWGLTCCRAVRTLNLRSEWSHIFTQSQQGSEAHLSLLEMGLFFPIIINSQNVDFSSCKSEMTVSYNFLPSLSHGLGCV